MAFTLSPSVSVTETDFSGIVSLVATTPAAFVGRFDKGPVNERTLISSVKELQETFGTPSVERYGSDWWTCYNFLQYGNNLTIVNVAGSGATSGSAGLSADFPTSGETFFTFRSKDEGAQVNGALEIQVVTAGMTYPSGTLTDAFSFRPATSSYAARFGATADELSLAVVDRKGTYGPSGSVLEIFEGMSQIINAVDDNGTALYYKYQLANSNFIKIDDGVGEFESIFGFSGLTGASADYSGGAIGAIGITLGVDVTVGSADLDANGNLVSTKTRFDRVPLDAHEATTDARKGINGPYTYTLQGGAYGTAVTSSNKQNAWDTYFADPDVADVSILIAGDADNALNQKVIDIAATRKDCLAVISKPVGDGFADSASLANKATLTEVTESTVRTYRNSELNRDTSYAAMDGNWKQQNDSYNGITRWLPLNGDIAGLLARTETDFGAWFSPGGYARGNILNVNKLAFNPSKAARDLIYSAGINNVVAFPGSGTVLWGDKTLQTKPSAFDRIQVRRLFNILEKSFATSANFILFEQNDAFTRRSFVNQIDPVLRDVQNRRGLENYRIVCDESNNPGSVVDRGEFVCDIFLQPTKSVQFVKLNFVANNSGSFFTEA
jgi:hypothetical protein